MSVVWLVADGNGAAIEFQSIYRLSVGPDIAGEEELDTWGVRAFMRNDMTGVPGAWIPVSAGYETVKEASERMKDMLSSLISAEYDPATLLDEKAKESLKKNKAFETNKLVLP